MPLMLEMVKSHGGGNKSESSITEIISAVRDLNALAKGEAPPKEEKEEDMLDKVFKYGGPILTALMTRQPLQMPGAVQPVQADIGPVGGGRVIDVPSSVNGAAQRPVDAEAKLKREVVEKINSYMELLIMAAERQSEPASYAQMISDMLPDEHFDTLIGELKAPDWFSKLTGGNPRIIAQQAWFTQLRQILIEVDQSSDESATTTQSNASAGQAEAGNG